MKACDNHWDKYGIAVGADYQVSIRRLSDDGMVTVDLCHDCMFDHHQGVGLTEISNKLGQCKTLL